MAKKMVAHSLYLACLPMLLDAKLCCSLFEGQLSSEPVQRGAMQTGALCHQNPSAL